MAALATHIPLTASVYSFLPFRSPCLGHNETQNPDIAGKAGQATATTSSFFLRNLYHILALYKHVTTSPLAPSFLQRTKYMDRTNRPRHIQISSRLLPVHYSVLRLQQLMSLSVNLPPTVSRQSTLQLPRFGKNKDGEALSVRDPCLIQSSRRLHVFSGFLILSSCETPVVCKLSFGSVGQDRLMRESVIYDHLKNLQGKVVPRCYGYFEDRKTAGCRVLEHAGEALTTCF